MKYLKFLAVILFVSNNVTAQKETHYYMRIKSGFAYTLQKDRMNELKVVSNMSSIDKILNKFIVGLQGEKFRKF